MLEDSRCNSMVGMRAESGIAHVAHHLVSRQILGQRTGAVEMCLHAGVERGKPALQHVGLLGRKVKCQSTTARKQRMCALGSSIHTMALELRARNRSCDELARSPTGANTVECLKRQNGTQTQRIAPKDTSHRVIHHEQRAGIASRATKSAKIGHTQTKPADRVDEPPQMRPLGIKRSIKFLGSGGKRLDGRRTHQRDIAAIKAVRKRIGKVVRKGQQAVAGVHNPQLRQRCWHMRGREQPRLTRAGPQSPSLF